MPTEDSLMIVRKFVRGFLILMILGASAAALHAQRYRVFAMGTASSLFAKKYYNVYGAAFGSTYKIDHGFMVGGEYHVWRNLGVEGAYTRVLNTLVVTNFFNSPVPIRGTGYDIGNQRVSLDAVAHSSNYIRGVRPYLSVGVEFDRFEPVGHAAETARGGFNGVPNTVLSPDDKFGYNFGFGLEIKLVRMVDVRVDLRDHITGIPTFGLPKQATSGFTAYYPISGTANHIEASAGFVFLFGK